MTLVSPAQLRLFALEATPSRLGESGFCLAEASTPPPSRIFFSTVSQLEPDIQPSRRFRGRSATASAAAAIAAHDAWAPPCLAPASHYPKWELPDIRTFEAGTVSKGNA